MGGMSIRKETRIRGKRGAERGMSVEGDTTEGMTEGKTEEMIAGTTEEIGMKEGSGIVGGSGIGMKEGIGGIVMIEGRIGGIAMTEGIETEGKTEIKETGTIDMIGEMIAEVPKVIEEVKVTGEIKGETRGVQVGRGGRTTVKTGLRGIKIGAVVQGRIDSKTEMKIGVKDGSKIRVVVEGRQRIIEGHHKTIGGHRRIIGGHRRIIEVRHQIIGGHHQIIEGHQGDHLVEDLTIKDLHHLDVPKLICSLTMLAGTYRKVPLIRGQVY